MPSPAPGPLAALETDLWMKQAATFRRANDLARAVALYRKVLAAVPGHPAALREMGTAAYETGAFDVANGLLEQAVRAAPKSAPALAALGRVRTALGRADAAIGALRRAIAIMPSDARLHAALGEAQLDAGDRDEARRSFRAALDLQPDFALAAHMLAGLGDNDAKPRNAYAAGLFDDYAEFFESHLVKTLGYDLPARIAATIDTVAPGRRFGAALDLGCGTGLVAAAFGGRCDAIDGIDLSPKMVEVARTKGSYRRLEVADLAGFLAAPAVASAYDLVVAADVFIYVGALESAFAGIARALRPGGLLAFSIEELPRGEFAILSSARFAHARGYVERLAAANDFLVLADEAVDLRKERGRPIAGRLLVLSRP